ncbi:hypothetical protein ILUMI_03086 [Ignelater luminosus]|uniref:Uncharacterized protein n=1 Tax=Ignelater luminosus TaxID=2038154 RepID=A0A8K0DBL9_IGNLU|nr:hypothetical protein ILUMI_03086 [Ignelater luminosus]
MLQRNKISILLIVLILNLAYAYICPPNYCSTIKCGVIEKCEKNQVLKPGGVCNCCNQCFSILEEGDECTSFVLLGVPPPTRECGEGLLCLEGVCKRIIPLK